MAEFLALLLAYYTCDAAAQTQEPLGGQRLACVEIYEEVKGYFAPLDPAPIGTPEYGAERIATYRAFSAWEAENAETVAGLRAEARTRAAAECRVHRRATGGAVTRGSVPQSVPPVRPAGPRSRHRPLPWGDRANRDPAPGRHPKTGPRRNSG